MADHQPKKVMTALERVFTAEIEGRLPFQSKATIYLDLMAAGLVEPVRRRFGTGWSATVVSGYALTHAGRILYGENCTDCSADDDHTPA